MSLLERFNRNKLKMIRSCLIVMLLVSVVTLFTAYYDPDFYFLDYASGYFYGVVGAASLLLLIAARNLVRPAQT